MGVNLTTATGQRYRLLSVSRAEVEAEYHQAGYTLTHELDGTTRVHDPETGEHVVTLDD